MAKDESCLEQAQPVWPTNRFAVPTEANIGGN